MRTTRAPCATSFSMVGSAARMRVSSATAPSFTGTLKSTRTSTRLPGGVQLVDGFDIGHRALLLRSASNSSEA